MTCKEKLGAMYPEWREAEFQHMVRTSCPAAYTEEPMTQETYDRLRAKGDLDANTVYYIHPDQASVDKAKTTGGTILDSGDRTEFASGAVRDMREGKGRFDISPLEAMADLLTDEVGYRDPVLNCLAIFLKTGDTDMLLGALKSFSFKAYNGCIPTMLLDTAIHFEEGAKKYGEANYRKGIPVWCYIDSATRHYLKWLRGDKEEPHNRAFVWNLLCCIWEVDYGEEWREAQKSKEER